ncbi:MAG: phosphoribosylaminoimidazolesuccinocarboxamide synthase [Minisyncoccales bacterium]
MEKIAEGKTKEIWSGIVKIVSKPVITAQDGRKKDPMTGKDKWANNTTSNVFELLNRHGIKTHFIKRAGENGFWADECEMIPDEVVVRRIGTGSFLKRNPDVADGTVFDELEVEFFFKDDELHDPIIVFQVPRPNEWNLHKAHEPIKAESYITTIDSHFTSEEAIHIKEQAKQIFLILEKAWKELGVTLWDFKIEFGRRKDNNEIVVADVIENDSWRIRTKDGKQLDKQVYREGGEIKEVSNLYEIVSDLTNRFSSLDL